MYINNSNQQRNIVKNDNELKNVADILAQFTDKEIRQESTYHNQRYNYILDIASQNSEMIGVFTEYLFGLVEDEENNKINKLGGKFLTAAVFRKVYESELLRRENES